jgi:HK97 family phage portal protein
MLFGKRGEQRMQNLGSGGGNVFLGFNSNGQLTMSTDAISTDAALRNSDIFSCANLIASDVSSARFILKGLQDDPLLNLVGRHPNQLTNAFTFWQSVVLNLLLNGNSYCGIWRTNDGRPTKLEFVPNAQTNVLMTDDSQQLFYQFIFNDGRSPVVLRSKDVLHFRLLSKDGGVIGLSPLLALASEVKLQNQTDKLLMTTLMQSINPSGRLTVAKGLLDKEAKDNIRTEFEKANTGVNAGRLLVLDSTMTYDSSSGIDADVLKILSGVDWTRQQIAKVFAVPKDMLDAESEHSNIDQIRGLYATCLTRYTNPVTSELTSKLCLPGQSFGLDIEPAIDPDGSALEGRMSTAVKNGLYSQDQAQQILANAIRG